MAKIVITKQYFDEHISNIQAAVIELEYSKNKDIKDIIKQVDRCISVINYECGYLYQVHRIEEELDNEELVKTLNQ